MGEPALVVSQSGGVTRGLEPLVATRAEAPVETRVTDRPEDGEYYLSPATVDAVEQWVSEAEGEAPLVVVDGSLHPGQAVDLRGRLPPVTLRDRRGAVWEVLAGSNPVAAARFELRRARLERRNAAATQRDAATQGPTGTSGRLAAREEAVQTCRETLETRREAARERARTGYDDVDGRVVVLGRVGAPTTDVWSGLTGESRAAGVGRPAQPRTATATVGPHTLAVTDTPGVVGERGLPDWLTTAVPGLVTSLADADCVLGVGDSEGLADAVREGFDATWRSVGPAAADAREALAAVFGTAEYAVRLPYDDDAHALVSELHDRAAVRDTEYGDAVYLRVAVSRTGADELRRRVAAVDGETRRLDEE